MATDERIGKSLEDFIPKVQWGRGVNDYKMQTQATTGQIGMPGMNPSGRLGEVPSAATTLNERLGVLMKTISDMGQRLGPVMRPSPPANQGHGMAPQNYGANTQLGQAIAQATSGIEIAISELLDMLDRLEL